MKLSFVKYQGTGNDFVMIDNREGIFPDDTDTLVQKLCDRRLGIGADGVILIKEHNSLDFTMIYFNADGSQSMCGNGSRCAVHYANSLGMIVGNETNFLSTDGPHFAKITGDIIHLHLADVEAIKSYEDEDLFIDTGSPHHIRFLNDVESCDVASLGSAIRNEARYAPGGTNVNFVEIIDRQSIFVRTFERGVEAETLSCGTGVTAASIAAYTRKLKSPIHIKTLGGDLKVSFEQVAAERFENVFLIGPAKRVFAGEIEL